MPALMASERATLEHVGSRDTTKARELADALGVAKSGSYEDVLRDPDVDGVYISTPPAFHAHWVAEAAAHGKHVLCEKPAAVNHAEAIEIVNTCRANDVSFLEGYMFLFHPQHRKAMELIGEEGIGEPRMLTATFTYPRPPDGDFRLQPDLGGGTFLDSLGYPVAVATMVTDEEPTRIGAALIPDPLCGVDQASSITLEFPSGLIARLFTGYGLHYQSTYEILGTRGKVVVERAFAVNPDHEPQVTVERGLDTTQLVLPKADQFRLMIEHFVDSVSSPDLRTANTARFLRQQKVLDTAMSVARSGDSQEGQV